MRRATHKDDQRAGEGSKVAFALSALAWVALWAAAAAVVGSSLLLAGPGEVLRAFAETALAGDFWRAVGRTSVRILSTMAASAAAGTVLGLASARFRLLGTFLAPPLQVMKSAPVGCVVVVVLVMSGSAGALAAIVAFVALPPFYVAALDGCAARPLLAEQVLRRAGAGRLRVFLSCTWPAMLPFCAARPLLAEQVLRRAGAGRLRVFLSCTWPAMLPFFRAAAKTAVGLSWKAGITAELLCVPLGSVGAAVYASKLTLDMPSLLMWTVVVMALGWASEKALLWLLGLTGASPRWAVRLARRRVAAGGQPPASLEIDRATFGYGDAPVLSDVRLTVGPGERLCLMAPTGAGKTTLVSLLAGMGRPQSGNVSAPALLGIVAQRDTLVETLTFFENVQLVCGESVPPKRLAEELSCLLPGGALHRPACELSGGTRRLVQIARAVYGPGRALVMDEPFAGLDEQANERACAFILAHQGGRALLVTTHHAADAERLDASVATLDGVSTRSCAGRVTLCG